MFRFQNNEFLFAIILIPILVLLYLSMLYWRKKKLAQMGTPRLVQQQILGFIPARQSLKFILRSAALLMIIIACANLQKGGTTETVQRKGIDVMIALDVSRSMLAKDIQPDRLTKAKQFIEKLTTKMSNDRIGLVVFAGRSYLQVPLTIDYSALRLLLQTVTPDMIPTQGTVIGDAIKLSNQSFSTREKKFKSIIVISDGEDHDEAAIDAANKAMEEGVIIHTVGIGSPQGATLFDPNTNGPKIDAEGNPVVSKLNEIELKNIATAGKGTYNLLNNSDAAANKIIDELDNMEQRNLGQISYANYSSYFQYFLAIALMLLMADLLIPGAKSQKKALETSGTKIAFLLLLIISSTQAQGQNSKKLIANGNKLYLEGKYKEAATLYGQSLKKDTNHIGIGAYNLGNALYQQKQPDAARKSYEIASKKAVNKNAQTANQFNIGNTYMQEKKWSEAIEQFKKTLRQNPQDQDAKYNLAYAQKMLKKDGDGGKDNKKDKREEQKENQNKENKQQQDEKKDQKQDQKNDNQQQKEQQKENEQEKQVQPSKLSEQQAEQLLNALQQEEKKLQEKKQKVKGAPTRLEKDW